MSDHIMHARSNSLRGERVEGISQAERELAQHAFAGVHETAPGTRKKPSKRCAPCAPRQFPSRRTREPHAIPGATRLQECASASQAARRLWAACAVPGFWNRQRPYVWRLFQWFGERTGVPMLVAAGFWLVVAISRAVCPDCFVDRESAPGGEADWMRQSK